MFLIVYYLIVSALAAKCKTNCAEGQCDTVGGTEICTSCQAGHVPINGKCTAKAEASAANCKKNDGNVLTDDDTKCGKCEGATFMYKGGCYDKTGDLGQVICKTPGSSNGICQDCQAGYFKNPVTGLDATHQSCIACNETTAVDNNLGVANCAECTAPAASGSSGNQKAKCTACVDGYYGAACDQNCDASCKSCKGTAKQCTSCKDPSPYFKKGTGETGECVANEDACKASNTHFLVASTKTCYPCSDTKNNGIADCQTCTSSKSDGAAKAVTVTCSACATPTKKPNTAGTKCVDCAAAGCAKCSDEGVCVECDSSKKLSPLKDACLDSCPAGTYDSSNVCTPCHTSCAGCKDDNTAASCTACYPGSVLSYGSDSTKGTCIPECTGKYLENCADGQCTASIAGSKYCSKCKSGYVPVDGMCVLADKTRAPPTGCTPNSNDGVCTTCTEKYFLESGGCYQAEKFPGNTLCTTADAGKCTNCANGQQVDGTTGSCPACDSTCKTCSEKNNPAKCSACFSGYYLDSGNACKKCSETSGNIQGVKNCISCDPPANNQGSVTCYVKTNGGDSGDNSTGSDPKLSSGAIAGISVAAVVVVGGLVGFLCWWFVCRGKA